MDPIDLTGQRFGRLTVLRLNPEPYISPAGKKTRRWDCRCDCGREVTMLRSALVKATSCGCARRPKQIDMTGQRFGRLTVVGEAELPRKRSNGQVTGWVCRCVCGNEVIVTRKDLLSGKVHSCGCLLSDASRDRVESDNVFEHYDGTSISHLRSHKARSDSTTGHRGVRVRCTSKGEQRYQAHLTLRSKTIYLGTYRTLEEAIQARQDGEKKYYSPIITTYEDGKE